MNMHPHHRFKPSLSQHIFSLLFLVAAVVAAVGAVASPRANQGSMRLSNALPSNIIVVTNTNDSGPGSLRAALAAANDGDTIDATGVSGTILLTSSELQITHNVTINGPGAENLAVDGNATSRVFENFASNVTISGLTITNGEDDQEGGGILNHGGLTLINTIVSNSFCFPIGGGIFCNGGATLTVINSAISGNAAGVVGLGGFGGGIYADGATVAVSNSTISGNGTLCGGGGIFANNTQLTVIDSTISDNAASSPANPCSGTGGGIFSSGGTLTLMNSTISGNQAFASGGGITNDGDLTVTNSTLSNNSAAIEAGGIWNGGDLTVTNSTISGNSALPTNGGAIFNAGEATIGDTVLNAGASGGTILNSGGTVTSIGYNLASDDGGGVLTGPGDQINTDPMLGPLQNNGGPTFTHALLPGSPAIDAGDPSFTPPPSRDQRGCPFVRVFNGRIDIGSFEAQPPSRPCPTPRPRPTPHPRPSQNDS